MSCLFFSRDEHSRWEWDEPYSFPHDHGQLEPDHQLSITNDLFLYFVKEGNIEALTYINDDIYSSDVSIAEGVEPIIPDYDPVDTKIYIDHLINLRNKSRSNKDWASSDFIRDRLNEFDIVLEDTADGTSWHWK